MSTGMVLDPTISRAHDISTSGLDAGHLRGKIVGIRVDQIWRAWDWISELWAAEFRKAGAEVKFWRSCGRSGEEGERMNEELTMFLDSIDIAVIGLANCGSLHRLDDPRCARGRGHAAFAHSRRGDCPFRGFRKDLG